MRRSSSRKKYLNDKRGSAGFTLLGCVVVARPYHLTSRDRESQNVSEEIRCDDRSGNAGNVFFHEVGQSVAGRHFKEEVAAQFLRDYRRIMPANSVGNVVRQISCHCRRGAHSSSVDIRNIRKFWRL